MHVKGHPTQRGLFLLESEIERRSVDLWNGEVKGRSREAVASDEEQNRRGEQEQQ